MLKEAWKDYERRVVPAGAGDAQRADTEKAFYAGAVVAFYGLLDRMDPSEEPTADDEAVFNELHRELQVFIEQQIKAAI